MRRVNAQFRPRRRPSRGVLAGLAALAACAVAAVGGVAWEYRRVAELQVQLARLAEPDRAGALPPPPRPTPAYDASARQFLRERGAGWAPMLRTLESGAMIGVTPTAVEFNASDGVARAELDYADSTALFDYLGRINEGMAPGPGLARWTLVQTRVQPGAAQTPAIATTGMAPLSAPQSVATIRSVWLDSPTPGGRAP